MAGLCLLWVIGDHIHPPLDMSPAGNSLVGCSSAPIPAYPFIDTLQTGGSGALCQAQLHMMKYTFGESLTALLGFLSLLPQAITEASVNPRPGIRSVC